MPFSSPPTSDLNPAPSCEPTFLDRTVMLNTSPNTSVISYPGRSFIVLKIMRVPPLSVWTGSTIPWRGGTRTGGPAHAAPGGPQQPGPDRAQAAVDQDPAAHRAGLHRAEGPGPQRGPAHRLRGGRLPEYLRVLGRPRGHLPHRRGPVHPPVLLLSGRHRQAAAAGCGRAPAGRGVGRRDGAEVRDRDRGRA